MLLPVPPVVGAPPVAYPSSAPREHAPTASVAPAASPTHTFLALRMETSTQNWTVRAPREGTNPVAPAAGAGPLKWTMRSTPAVTSAPRPRPRATSAPR